MVVLKVVSTLLTAFLGLIAMFVDVRQPERARIRRFCVGVLLLSAGVAVSTQVLELVKQRNSTERTLRQLLRLQTRIVDFRLSGDMLASRDAVASGLLDCLMPSFPNIHEGTDNKACSATKAPPFQIAISLCKTVQTCENAPVDFTATFGDLNGKPSCIQAGQDGEDKSLVRFHAECAEPRWSNPPLQSISLSDFQKGAILVHVDAVKSEAFPHDDVLRKSKVAWLVLDLNGIPVRIAGAELKEVKTKSNSTYGYMYSFKPADLGINEL